MVTINNNPMIYTPSNDYGICFAMTRDTLIDTEVYQKFLYNIENRFRKSEFYRQYKAHLMDLGLAMDQKMPAISAEVADIEMHHNFIPLKYMAIMIIEHLLNTKGCCTTFEVVRLLEDAHRNNWVAVIMLSTTQHAFHHTNPTDFISLKQCYGDPFAFINKYIDGMTLDICYALLLHLKQEEQYGGSFSPMMIKAREDILSWQNMGAINNYQY